MVTTDLANEQLTALWNALLAPLRAGLTLLPDKPEETAENTLKALWIKANGTPQSAVKAESSTLTPLRKENIATLRDLIQKRLAGTPLAHLTERQHFMGLEMLAGPEALVPRHETELLARAALAKAEELARSTQPLTIIDICTGSGNVALALASHLREKNIAAQTFAADLSEEAVGLARRNAQALALEQLVEFRAGDLLAPFDNENFLGKVDLLTCNPPYITEAKVELMATEIAVHEPKLAFNGGPFGISILMRIIEESSQFLKRGGWLAFEVGLGQGASLVKRIARQNIFSAVETVEDFHGNIRAILARK